MYRTDGTTIKGIVQSVSASSFLFVPEGRSLAEFVPFSDVKSLESHGAAGGKAFWWILAGGIGFLFLAKQCFFRC